MWSFDFFHDKYGNCAGRAKEALRTVIGMASGNNPWKRTPDTTESCLKEVEVQI